jgi:small conductance mechanosensitive channel
MAIIASTVIGTNPAQAEPALGLFGFRQVEPSTELYEACSNTPSAVCRFVFEQTGSSTLASISEVLSTNGLRILLILALAWILRRIVARNSPRIIGAVISRQEAADRELADRSDGDLTDDQRIEMNLRRERGRQRSSTLGHVLSSIVSAVIVFVAGLMILGELGVNLAPLIAGAGVVGIALGFGAQQMVKDFLAGIFIVLEDEYGVGDVVDTGLASGVVERLSLRVTQLRDVNGTVWYVPNGEIQRVGNRSQLWARAVLDIDVAYDTDIDVASEALLRVARQLWHEQIPEKTIIAEPEFWGVERFGADGVALRLVVKTEPTEQWATARELRGRIKQEFDALGIEIPFPQRTVWQHTVDPSAKAGETPEPIPD